VRGALRLRDGIDQLLALALSPGGDESSFRQAYERVAQTVWGNADGQGRGER
jgi:hypothetical protein